MEISLQDVKDIANRRANRKSNKLKVIETVFITIGLIALLAIIPFGFAQSVKYDNFKNQKITYSIPTAGDLIYENGIYTLNGYLIKPDKEYQEDKTFEYAALILLLIFISSFLCASVSVFSSASMEQIRLLDYYYEHKELPKEE